MVEQDNNHQREEEPQKALREHIPTQPEIVRGEGESPPGQASAPEQPGDPLELALLDAAQNRDRWLRAVADCENIKKRAASERTALLKYKHDDLLRDLLPVIDNMERALEHAQSTEGMNAVVEGVNMVLSMFNEILKKYGVKEIDALNHPFDPNFHEALARVPNTDKPNNTVMQVAEKGYLYNDRLLRPARVIVSHG